MKTSSVDVGRFVFNKSKNFTSDIKYECPQLSSSLPRFCNQQLRIEVQCYYSMLVVHDDILVGTLYFWNQSQGSAPHNKVDTLLERYKCAPRTHHWGGQGHLAELQLLVLTATTLIYAIGAGITAAATTCLQSILNSLNCAHSNYKTKEPILVFLVTTSCVRLGNLARYS